MPDQNISQVIKKYRKILLMVDGVVGIGEGELEGKPCIKVFVDRKTKEIEGHIPSVFDGYPVCIVESGRFKALDT